MFDFSAAGPGTFKFDPVSTFQVIGLGDIVETISDTTRLNVANAGSVSITVTDDVSKRELNLEKRARVTCSNPTQSSFISASFSEGKSLAAQAASYVSSRGASDPVYKAYFGNNPTSSVISTFNAVAGENSSSRTLSCTDPLSACGGGVIAYTVTATTNIYYCSIFYNEVAAPTLCSGNTVNARNIRGGTTLHELTHALSGTDDVGYGCPANQALSDSNKIRNADNYNVSTQTSCCLLGVCPLTCDHNFCSALPARSSLTPSARRVIEVSERYLSVRILFYWSRIRNNFFSPCVLHKLNVTNAVSVYRDERRLWVRWLDLIVDHRKKKKSTRTSAPAPNSLLSGKRIWSGEYLVAL